MRRGAERRFVRHLTHSRPFTLCRATLLPELLSIYDTKRSKAHHSIYSHEIRAFVQTQHGSEKKDKHTPIFHDCTGDSFSFIRTRKAVGSQDSQNLKRNLPFNPLLGRSAEGLGFSPRRPGALTSEAHVPSRSAATRGVSGVGCAGETPGSAA